MGGIDLDLQGHLAISTHKTALNFTLVYNTDLGRPRGDAMFVDYLTLVVLN